MIRADAGVIPDSRSQQGVPPLSCPHADDSKDDAVINLTDPVAVRNYLFQEGDPPAPPGPTDCGEDTTPDDLPGCGMKC